ncbi:hypothetical protein EfmAA96_05850 [Enterococcus faecium]|nr:hypothetical protein EfmAA96_05850 [Enterococcus faecium]
MNEFKRCDRIWRMKDLMITEVSYETLQKKKPLVVDAVLSPTPRACRSCGSTVVDGNGKAIIGRDHVSRKKENVSNKSTVGVVNQFSQVKAILI